ncbi:MAG: hypothetical protein ACOYY2_02270 [Actinomycetota bacterium]
MLRTISAVLARRQVREAQAVEAGRVWCRRGGTDVDIEECLRCSYSDGTVRDSGGIAGIRCRFRPDRFPVDVPPA